MTASVNLMTEGAKFRAAAQRSVQAWSVAIGLLGLALFPLGGWTWMERRPRRPRTRSA